MSFRCGMPRRDPRVTLRPGGPKSPLLCVSRARSPRSKAAVVPGILRPAENAGLRTTFRCGMPRRNPRVTLTPEGPKSPLCVSRARSPRSKTAVAPGILRPAMNAGLSTTFRREMPRRDPRVTLRPEGPKSPPCVSLARSPRSKAAVVPGILRPAKNSGLRMTRETAHTTSAAGRRLRNRPIPALPSQRSPSTISVPRRKTFSGNPVSSQSWYRL